MLNDLDTLNHNLAPSFIDTFVCAPLRAHYSPFNKIERRLIETIKNRLAKRRAKVFEIDLHNEPLLTKVNEKQLDTLHIAFELALEMPVLVILKNIAGLQHKNSLCTHAFNVFTERYSIAYLSIVFEGDKRTVGQIFNQRKVASWSNAMPIKLCCD